MSDCVFHAFAAHLEATTGQTPTTWDKRYFWAMRRLLDKDGTTHGSIAPWIVKRLAKKHGLGVRVQTSNYWTKKHWTKYAPSRWARLAACAIDYEYNDVVTLEPAVYLLYGVGHAVFSTHVPEFLPIVAIQLRKEEERD